MLFIISGLGKCPACGEDLGPFFNDHLPDKDDLAICYSCLIILIFNDDFSLRIMSSVEFASMSVEKQTKMKSYQEAVLQVRRRKQAENN